MERIVPGDVDTVATAQLCADLESLHEKHRHAFLSAKVEAQLCGTQRCEGGAIGSELRDRRAVGADEGIRWQPVWEVIISNRGNDGEDGSAGIGASIPLVTAMAMQVHHFVTHERPSWLIDRTGTAALDALTHSCAWPALVRMHSDGRSYLGVLAAVSVLERALFDLYRSQPPGSGFEAEARTATAVGQAGKKSKVRKGTAPNMILRELLESPQLEAALHPACLAVLQTLFLPQGLNLRNLVWHGFVGPNHLFAAQEWLGFVLVVIASLPPPGNGGAEGAIEMGISGVGVLSLAEVEARAEVTSRDFFLLPSYTEMPGSNAEKRPPRRWEWVTGATAACDSVDLFASARELVQGSSLLPIYLRDAVTEGLSCYNRGADLDALILLLPALEMALRCVWVVANSDVLGQAGQRSALVADTDVYYTTLDGYGQKSKHAVLIDFVLAATGGGCDVGSETRPNCLGNLIKEGAMALLRDFFMMEHGVRLRGRICHGEISFASLGAGADHGRRVCGLDDGERATQSRSADLIVCLILALCKRFWPEQGQGRLDSTREPFDLGLACLRIIDARTSRFHPHALTFSALEQAGRAIDAMHRTQGRRRLAWSELPVEGSQTARVDPKENGKAAAHREGRHYHHSGTTDASVAESCGSPDEGIESTCDRKRLVIVRVVDCACNTVICAFRETLDRVDMSVACTTPGEAGRAGEGRGGSFSDELLAWTQRLCQIRNALLVGGSGNDNDEPGAGWSLEGWGSKWTQLWQPSQQVECASIPYAATGCVRALAREAKALVEGFEALAASTEKKLVAGGRTSQRRLCLAIRHVARGVALLAECSVLLGATMMARQLPPPVKLAAKWLAALTSFKTCVFADARGGRRGFDRCIADHSVFLASSTVCKSSLL